MFQQMQYYNCSENRENIALPGRHKDSNGSVSQCPSKMQLQGGRTVLGSLTNKPQDYVSIAPKQVSKNDRSCKYNALQPVAAHCTTGQSHVHIGARQDKMVDLSCHEMDTSLDCENVESAHAQQHELFEESHGSPVLLDTSCSENDVSLEDEECQGDDEELKERTDRLYSMFEYRDEIYHCLRKAELAHRPKPNYMRRQTDITSNMRSILVDWLVEVADEYKLHRETLFLAVDYIDRFLSVMAVQRSKLQLVGTAAMFIAAFDSVQQVISNIVPEFETVLYLGFEFRKYEEIYPPDVGEFVYITDDTYTKQQVLRMESLILKVLAFDVATPTINLFCERYLKEIKADDRQISLSMYLIELSLVNGDIYLQYLPSIIACAAICLARYTLGLQEPWTQTLIDVTQYRLVDFEGCVNDLHATFANAPNHPQQAIQEKYRQTRFHEVSLLQPPTTVYRRSC